MRHVVWVVITAALVAAVSGCVAGTPANDGAGGGAFEPPAAMPPAVPSPREPGLTGLPDGRVQALGRLARIDLEGGFWAIVEGAGTQQGADKVVAVIANADEWERTLEALEGSVVIAVGRRFEGASIRMAGPEVVVESIAEAGTVPGAPK
ncbi:hypothetical protein MX659_00025 [Coriobacteriia bacterium Es71-Z0120]|uniref:hypothetical protein n=1 Tax=Parvivirga hydrogeniphila TaxID=2939460 RepID=UPI00226087C4|nr:hypothetical protein [Parvivirga hydrogeniphila]MCL4078004.1 hypothetical protein [Parvivirga hydrogeniphila]